MTLTKAFVKYIDGGDTFWIDVPNFFSKKENNPPLVRVFIDKDGKPSNEGVWLNVNNVIYIKFTDDYIKIYDEARKSK